MARHGKNYRTANAGLVEDAALLAPEAIEQVRTMAFAKFDETVD
ncbi:MAG: 50S ribosomal protein L1, partial [Gemmatimonadota bacterium]